MSINCETDREFIQKHFKRILTENTLNTFEDKGHLYYQISDVDLSVACEECAVFILELMKCFR